MTEKKVIKIDGYDVELYEHEHLPGMVVHLPIQSSGESTGARIRISAGYHGYFEAEEDRKFGKHLAGYSNLGDAIESEAKRLVKNRKAMDKRQAKQDKSEQTILDFIRKFKGE